MTKVAIHQWPLVHYLQIIISILHDTYILWSNNDPGLEHFVQTELWLNMTVYLSFIIEQIE